MRVLEIADPSLVVLVGPAGSGKSTFAARHFRPDEILSSDAYRAMISGDEADQRATRAAFGRLHRDLRRRLAAGQTTVVDATNLERAARRALLLRASVVAVPAVAVVLDLPPAIVRARNAGRQRTVDTTVLTRHLEGLRKVVDGDSLLTEGFATVVVLGTADELDAVRIIRAGGPRP